MISRIKKLLKLLFSLIFPALIFALPFGSYYKSIFLAFLITNVLAAIPVTYFAEKRKNLEIEYFLKNGFFLGIVLTPLFLYLAGLYDDSTWRQVGSTILIFVFFGGFYGAIISTFFWATNYSKKKSEFLIHLVVLIFVAMFPIIVAISFFGLFGNVDSD